MPKQLRDLPTPEQPNTANCRDKRCAYRTGTARKSVVTWMACAEVVTPYCIKARCVDSDAKSATKVTWEPTAPGIEPITANNTRVACMKQKI